MADSQDPFAQNIIGVQSLIEEKTNKVPGQSEDPEGVAGEKYGVLTLNLTDEELLKLRDEWEKKYAPYETKIHLIQEKNKESYLGKKANGQWLAGDENIAANLQFEALETFLAATLSKEPDPVVFADNTPEGNSVSTAIKTLLQYHTDQLSMRYKLAQMVRQWAIYHLGVLKYGWNKEINDVQIENRKIKDFVFDPDGYVDAEGDFIGYLGERITVTAEKLIEMFPDAKTYIELETEGKMGTEVVYTEWWTNEYCFVTYKKRVLDKHKNEYFKYPEAPKDPLTGQPMVDPLTNLPMAPVPARNHFALPKKPYTFLSVYSLQEQPHDITGLIEQNIPNQRLITKRTEQIDFNISASNNSFALSEDNFNQETGKQFAQARKKGNPTLVPSGGPIDSAIKDLNAQSLPADVFNSLEINKNDLRQSWGVQGITSQPQDEDQTARGMILNQAHDTTRIGGGIGERIEQVAKGAYNWLTQLYGIFYDEQHFAAIMGGLKAVEYVTFTNAQMDRQIIVSVAPDSMAPKDEITEINMAQTLFDKGCIGPKTLLNILNFPNPDESAADGLLYKLDPMTYLQLNFPQFAQQIQQQQMMNQQAQMQAQAQGAGMQAQAQAQGTANGTPPEALTEPNKTSPAQDPASAALSQVTMPNGAKV